MKKISLYWFAAFGLTLFSAFAMTTSQTWEIKSGYSIKFVSKDPSGVFNDFSGDIKFDPNDLVSSKFNLKVKVSSISTGNGMMNKKAQTEEWFDASKYPTINFISSKITKSEKGYDIVGELEMKGVKKSIKIPTIYKTEGNGASFSGVFYVKRSLFGIGHKSDAVPDVMKIEFYVPVTKK